MNIKLFIILLFAFISCQDSTSKIKAKTSSEYQLNEEPKVTVQYGYAVVIYEIPIVEYIESVYVDNFGMIQYGTGICNVFYEKKYIYSDIEKFSNYVEDDSYRLMDFLKKRYDILYKPDRAYMNLQLRNCPDKEKYLNYTTKFVKKDFFLFAIYKDASIHKDVNYGI